MVAPTSMPMPEMAPQNPVEQPLIDVSTFTPETLEQVKKYAIDNSGPKFEALKGSIDTNYQTLADIVQKLGLGQEYVQAYTQKIQGPFQEIQTEFDALQQLSA